MRRATILLFPAFAFVAAAAWLVFGPDGASSRAQAGGAAPCSPAHTHAAGDFDETIDSGGFARGYLLHVPPSYTGAAPVPLVLLLHGAGGSAHGIADYTGFPAKADEAGFIAVMPLGTEPPDLPTGRIFNFLTFIPGMPDDVTFIGDLLDTLETQLCIDTTRVYAAGLSNGAMMSVRLACGLSERLAAIGAVAGVYYPPFSPDVPAEPGCPAEQPIAVIALHGTGDDIVPFAGEELTDLLPISTRHIENEVLPDWAVHNSCDDVPTDEQATDHARLVRYEGCENDVLVELYAVEGGAHVWPGADDLPKPDLNDEINATDLLWDFFAAHTRPAVQPTATQPVASQQPPAAAQPTATVAALPSTGAGSSADGRYATRIVVGLALALTSGGVWYAWMRSRR